jgi:hypothetical protein
MPIIAASEVDQSGTSITAATTPTSEALTPSPTSATRIGSPAATDRAEDQQQDDRGGGDADALGADVALGRRLDHLAAERDLHARPVRGLGKVDDPLGVLDRHRIRVRRVQLDRRVHGPAVRRDRALLPVRAGRGDDVRDGGDLPSRPSTVARTAGSVTRPSARTTTSTCSPAAAGNRWASRSWAARESEPRAV